MEPRSIEPKDIRVGDRVRAEANVTTVEGEITTIGSSGVIGVGSILSLVRGCWSFILLDRPEPPREPGSRWRDPATGYEYAKTDHRQVEYVLYRSASGTGGDWRLIPKESHGDAQIVRRLVPLDGPDA